MDEFLEMYNLQDWTRKKKKYGQTNYQSWNWISNLKTPKKQNSKNRWLHRWLLPNIQKKVNSYLSWRKNNFFLFLFLNLRYYIFYCCTILKVTFHLQVLQNIIYIPCVVQYILEPILHPKVYTSHTPTSSPYSHHWWPLVCSLYLRMLLLLLSRFSHVRLCATP